MTPRAKAPWMGACVNALYGLYTGALGVWGRSWWFTALAAYYTVLAAVRFFVLLALRGAGPEREGFITRFCGGTCLFLAVTLAGMTYLSLLDQRGTRHHQIVMITMALYAFVKITAAIVAMVRRERRRRPAQACLRTLTLADAAVSIFALQRSMLVTFPGMSAGHIRLMNALTGTAVYLLTAVLGIHLIGGKRVTMAKAKITEVNRKMAGAVTDGYKKIEDGVVTGYRKVEDGVVAGYTRIEDKFIDQFLTREGESVDDARKRLRDGREK